MRNLRTFNILSALIVGTFLGAGLTISGTTQPAKVIGFLDIFGRCDLTLLFVMGGAIAVHAPMYRVITKRSSPLLDAQWHIPPRRDVTPQLVFGAILFGIGWDLGGYCPGPGVAALLSGSVRPAVFVTSVVFGMLIYRMLARA